MTNYQLHSSHDSEKRTIVMLDDIHVKIKEESVNVRK